MLPEHEQDEISIDDLDDFDEGGFVINGPTTPRFYDDPIETTLYRRSLSAPSIFSDNEPIGKAELIYGFCRLFEEAASLWQRYKRGK